MSITATTWAWQQLDLRMAPKLILLCLAEHLNGVTGLCCPSVATIAKRTGCSLRCVQGHLRRLERRGLIITKARRRSSNLFVLNVGHDPAALTDLCGGQSAAAPPTQPAEVAGIPDLFGELYPADERASATISPAASAPKPEEEDSTRREEERGRACARSPAMPPSSEDHSAEKGGQEPRAAVLDVSPHDLPASASQPHQAAEPTAPIGTSPLNHNVVQILVPRGRWAPRRRAGPPPAPLPDDWSPTAEDRASALACGQDDPAALVPAFRLWHRARGICLPDWSAAFRLWCLRQPSFDRRSQPRPMSRVEREEAKAVACNRRAAELWSEIDAERAARAAQ